jgi:cytochrome c-type biogenesis protein CcmH/NrfF
VPLPDWLLWLLPLPLATGAAVVWASWTSRTRGPADTKDSVRDYERFRAALAAPPPTIRPRDRR